MCFWLVFQVPVVDMGVEEALPGALEHDTDPHTLRVQLSHCESYPTQIAHACFLWM